MNSTLILFLLFLFSASPIFAQCDAEPLLTPQTDILRSKTFELTEPSEVSMTLTASTKTSWLKTGSASAVLTIFINGEYSQDLILFAGEKAGNFPYEIFLGEFPRGSRKVDVAFNKGRSAKEVGKAAIADISIRSVSAKSPGIDIDQIARKHSPFINARPNSVDKFSDIPLVVYYEVFDEPDGATRITYSVIFSHEDGGTKGKALMARWGRMTDIEWIYEIIIDAKGEKISGIFQAANHEAKPFRGKYIFGSHPLMFNVTDNNNFADAGCSPLRFAPAVVRADLANGSRETLMEKFPWTYRIMSEEIIRENRVGIDPKDADKIFDPREYLYVEVYAEQENTAISVELDAADGKTNSSDLGIPQLRVTRNGYFRIAIQNPSKDFPGSVRLRCHAAGTPANEKCGNVRVIKVVKLDKHFTPKEILFDAEPKQIKPGETESFSRTVSTRIRKISIFAKTATEG